MGKGRGPSSSRGKRRAPGQLREPVEDGEDSFSEARRPRIGVPVAMWVSPSPIVQLLDCQHRRT